MNKIRTGDIVKILAGNDRGREGKVLRVLPQKNRVVIEGVAVSKRHVRPSQRHQQGGVVEFNRPINVSNVALVCGKCKQAVRVGFEMKGGKKVRVCKKCGAA